MPDQTGADQIRPDALHSFLQGHPSTSTYHIAYSGGLDSTVLLHLCRRLQDARPDYHFRVVHVHHGLQSMADDWVHHCTRVCSHLKLPLSILRVQVRKQVGQSPEEAARVARYSAIRSVLKPGDNLLTAQHLDDQAETLLLQLFRGAGLPGLAGMADCMQFHTGHILRPLLRTSRKAIRVYAEIHQLDWIEDPSNSLNDFDRNYLRHQIIPRIKVRWPAIDHTLSRSATHCAEASQLLNVRAQALLDTLINPEEPGRLPIPPLRALSRAEQKLTLREWLRREGYRMPPSKTIDGILAEILATPADRAPRIHWAEGEIRRYRNELFLLPPLERFTPPPPLAWDGNESLTLPAENGALQIEVTSGRGISLSRWKTALISVHSRTGGEQLKLAKRQGTHSLKKLFQESGIPPWVRERVPLIFLDNHLAATAMPFWVSDHVATQPNEPGVTLRWLHPAWIPGFPPEAEANRDNRNTPKGGFLTP